VGDGQEAEADQEDGQAHMDPFSSRPRVTRAREEPKRAKIRVRKKRIRLAVGPVVRWARDLIRTARV
jgi:hypothetical protein